MAHLFLILSHWSLDLVAERARAQSILIWVGVGGDGRNGDGAKFISLQSFIVSSVKILKVQLQRISVDFNGVDLGFLLPLVILPRCWLHIVRPQCAPARGRLWVTVQVWAGSCGSRSIRGEMIVSRLWGHRPPPAPRTQGDQATKWSLSGQRQSLGC